MENKPFSQNNFMGGIQNYPKLPTIEGGYAFGYCVDYRTDPQAVTLLPGTVKESGSVVTDLLKWGDLLPNTLDSYFYGDTGNIYHRTSVGSWSNLHMVASSHGNGLSYFFADDYLYYTGDSTFGRYGPVTGSSPQFVDDFLTAQGGVPQNTASLVLVSGSSEYAHAADSASLEITSDLTLETFFKATTLPAASSSMVLMGKWDESGATRSYVLDLFGVSGYFGSGSDGSLTVSSNTTDAPIDSACTGTSGTQSLSATNASFAVNQVILIHQTQGTNAGQWERNTIQGYTAGTITLQTPLLNTYTSGAQVIVMKQYTNVTVNNGVTWQPKAWNGTTGGILVFLANGTFTNNGTVSANALGFRGGLHNSYNNNTAGNQGESYTAVGTPSATNNGGGGGGGASSNSGDTGIGYGAGGSYGTVGTNGPSYTYSGGTTGITNGSSDLTTLMLGSGGGGGGSGSNSNDTGADGGNGGGVIFSIAATWVNNGTISANGQNGIANAGSGDGGGGGAGSGGAVFSKAQTWTNSGTITANGGVGSVSGNNNNGHPSGAVGGSGGSGRICVDYLTSYTGSSTPTLVAIQDNTLVTTTTTQARLGISNDGTAFEYLTQNLSTLTTGVWNRISVTWKASTSVATFYINAVSVGTSTGTKTSISSNASLLYVGAKKGASVVGSFFNGKLNDMRIWNNVQTATQIFNNNLVQVPTNSVGLQAYYTFNSVYTDATTNANNLTAVNSPTFDTADVPFPSPSTRLDIDTVQTLTGQTYTLPTAIAESSTNKLPFTPVNDPQKSIAFDVNAKGTGNWTVTIHDQQNRVVASKTITNANIISSGLQEFIFSTPWRIVIGKTYHAHVTSTVNDGSVVTGTSGDLSTVNYTSYFGFLVSDTAFHPIVPFLQYEIIGNERYLATWDGAFYHPNAIAFPTGWRVRCFGAWREYLAVGVWRGTAITSYTHGRIYFWDGIAPTFNFFIDVPDGQVNALWGRDSDLFIIAGYRGDLLNYQGNYFFDTGNSQSIKLRYLPKRALADTIEVYPGAMNYYRNLLHVGYGINMSSSTITQGVYAYGSLDPTLKETLSLDYIISTGNTGSTVSLGLVYPVGDQLIIGWRDGSGTGADVIDFTNKPAPHGRIELMINDDNAIWHDKVNYSVMVDFLPLRTGESIDCAINLDRSTWTTSTADATVGDIWTKMVASTGRAREIQLAVDLYATGTTSPTLLGVSAMHDPLTSEQQFGHGGIS